MASTPGAELVPLANMGMERPPAPAPRAAPDHVGTLLEPALPPSPSNEPNRFRSSASSKQKDGLGTIGLGGGGRGVCQTLLKSHAFSAYIEEQSTVLPTVISRSRAIVVLSYFQQRAGLAGHPALLRQIRSTSELVDVVLMPPRAADQTPAVGGTPCCSMRF